MVLTTMVFIRISTKSLKRANLFYYFSQIDVLNLKDIYKIVFLIFMLLTDLLSKACFAMYNILYKLYIRKLFLNLI